MQKIQESVLYYHHGDARSARKVLSVFVRLGIRIRRVEPGQVMEKVGYLAGLPGYTPARDRGEEAAENPVPKIRKVSSLCAIFPEDGWIIFCIT